MNYYNENDPKAAAWLRELIRCGHIPTGRVDERSIADVQPADLVGFIQCHFFAGIGGWALALKLAGWPEDRPVWTGSCPCQPFSAAGKGEGAGDDRHLWPILSRLIAERRPHCIFGEQVARAIGFNWLDGVSADLEAQDYAVGSAVLGAHSVGAPHIRQRLFWVAYANGRQRDGLSGGQRSVINGAQAGRQQSDSEFECSGAVGGLADTESERRNRRPNAAGENGRAFAEASCGLGHPHGTGSQQGRQAAAPAGHGGSIITDGSIGGMGDTVGQGLEGYAGDGSDGSESGRDDSLTNGPVAAASSAGAWSDFEFIPCADGKARRVESGTFPLAHGVPGRVGLLRGYGNAIVPQVAAQFIQAFVEAATP